MNWLKVQIDIDAARVAPLEAMLSACGAVSIDLGNAADEPILEPVPGATPLWARTRLTALFEPTVGEAAVRLAVASVTDPAAPPSTTFSVVENEDWIGKMRDALVPLRFGSGLWVCPPGKSSPDARATTITMEPGLAFGTGMHPTTALCMKWLAANPPVGLTVLDFGCGSGILGIAGLALGAASVIAVDIDPQALTAARDNALRNAAGDRLTVMAPDELRESDSFDVLLANILSGTLIDLAPVLRRHCRTGAALALSGILTEQAAAVADAYGDWCVLNAVRDFEGWVLMTGTAR
ncbi:MAG: 50S ribosomal protein L11 methyltransferase [Gammaproteobacteria bacterium]